MPARNMSDSLKTASRRQYNKMLVALNIRAARPDQRPNDDDGRRPVHVYAGTANPKKVRQRRAKNKVARKSRRANR